MKTVDLSEFVKLRLENDFDDDCDFSISFHNASLQSLTYHFTNEGKTIKVKLMQHGGTIGKPEMYDQDSQKQAWDSFKSDLKRQARYTYLDYSELLDSLKKYIPNNDFFNIEDLEVNT